MRAYHRYYLNLSPHYVYIIYIQLIRQIRHKSFILYVLYIQYFFLSLYSKLLDTLLCIMHVIFTTAFTFYIYSPLNVMFFIYIYLFCFIDTCTLYICTSNVYIYSLGLNVRSLTLL